MIFIFFVFYWNMAIKWKKKNIYHKAFLYFQNNRSWSYKISSTNTHTHTHLHLHFIILLHLSCMKFPAHVKSSVTPVQILESQKTNQFCLIALMLINCLNSSIFPRIPISYQYISLNSYTVSESRFSHLMLAFFFF